MHGTGSVGSNGVFVELSKLSVLELGMRQQEVYGSTRLPYKTNRGLQHLAERYSYDARPTRSMLLYGAGKDEIYYCESIRN